MQRHRLSVKLYKRRRKKGVGILSRENDVYSFIPELSIIPAPAATASK